MRNQRYLRIYLMKKNVKLDSVLNYILEKARQDPHILKVILFGSRARGDAHDKSDYDLAIESNFSHADWARWELEMKESVPTLLGLDLIKLSDTVGASLQEAISKEGIVIFERHR